MGDEVTTVSGLRPLGARHPASSLHGELFALSRQVPHIVLVQTVQRALRYTGCQRVLVTHGSLCPGDACPGCGQGTVYRQSEWSPVVRLKGQAPVGGTVYELERLGCHLCGKVHTAELPQEAGPEKYDPTVASTIATLRYGEGLPNTRIQRIQRSAGVPLPASTQWELVRDATTGGIQAAFDHLLELAGQGELVHNDDTPMRVLELSEKIKNQQPLLDEDPERRGVFTTNILSRNEGRPPIALFFTGPHHAGENLRDLLARRRQGLPPPIQMCDPLTRNMPQDLHVIIANCLTHGRRKFVDVVEAFPSEVEYVIECLKKVYRTDARATEKTGTEMPTKSCCIKYSKRFQTPALFVNWRTKHTTP